VQNLQTAAVKGIADRAMRLRAMLDDSAAPAPLVTFSTAYTAVVTKLSCTLWMAWGRAVTSPQYDAEYRPSDSNLCHTAVTWLAHSYPSRHASHLQGRPQKLSMPVALDEG
jgi:hypothetical protein